MSYFSPAILSLLFLLSFATSTVLGQTGDSGSCNEIDNPTCNCPVYTEGGPPVTILENRGLVLSDNDLNEVFLMQSAMVEIFPKTTTDFSTITLSTTYLPDTLTAEYNTIDGVLYIDGEASLTTYQSILSHVTIYISADEPDIVDRVICYFIFDGQFTSDPVCITVKIRTINDHVPLLNATALGKPYIEGSDGVQLLDTLEIIDIDHPQLYPMQQATITVAGWFCNSTDQILVDVTGTNISVNDTGPCVTLSGTDTIANYTTVLLTARYNNSADEPDLSNRTVVFMLSDGTNVGNFSLQLSLIPIDDHPTQVYILLANMLLTETSDTQALLHQYTMINLSDTDLFNQDTVDVYRADIEILNPSAVEYLSLVTNDYNIINVTNDSFYIQNDTVLLHVTGDSTSHLTITGTAAITTYELLLSNNILYGLYQFSEPPCPLNRSLRFTINNGSSDVFTITILPVNNKAPVLNTSTLSFNYTENEILKIFNDIIVTDSDVFCRIHGNTLISADITLSEPAPEDIEFTAVDWYWLIKNELVCNGTVTMTTPTDRDLVSLNATLYYYRCLVSSSTAVVKVRGQATLTQYQLLLRSVVYSNGMEELNPYKEINISY